MSTSSREPGYFTTLGATLFAIVALFVTLAALGAGGRIFGLEVDRRAVESSRQYAATNTDGFYTRLETVRKIDVQLAGLDASQTTQRQALESQRTLLVNEMRREVAQIPADARTPDMFPYEGVSR